MPRKRMLDPGIWTNEQLARLSLLQRLLYIGLISNADDEGRLKGSPLYLKSIIFPYDTIQPSIIQTGVERLAGEGLIIHYEVGGIWFVQHPNWRKYQYIRLPRPSTLPPPKDYKPMSTPMSTYMSTYMSQERNRKERKGNKVLCPECSGTGEIGKIGYQRNCPLCKGNKLVWRDDAELLR